MLSASGNSLLRGPKSTERILEDNSRNIAFAFTLGLDTILAGWALLAALDASLAASFDT